MQNNFVWLIFLLPLLSFAVISLILKPMFKDKPKLAGYVTIAAVSTSFILSVIVLVKLLAAPNHTLIVPEINCGQISLEVERCAGGRAETILLPHMGGAVHHPDIIFEAIKKAAGRRA